METYIFDNTLLSADGISIFELVQGEVDLGDGGLVLDLMNGPFNVGFCAAHGSSEVYTRGENGMKQKKGY